MSDSRDGVPIDETTWHWAWLRERVFASWYLLVPLAVSIALAGGIGRDWPLRSMFAFLGIVTFRLWDDVEDLPYDRRHHPTRVLCRLPAASSDGPYRFALGGLVYTGASTAAVGRSAPLLVVVLVTFGVYLARKRLPHLRVPFGHVLLIKVPALSFGLADGATPVPLAIGWSLSLYGLVGAYELAHDEAARHSPFAPALAVFDLVCLLAGPAVWLLYPRVFL